MMLSRIFSLNASHYFSTIDSPNYLGIFIAYSMQYQVRKMNRKKGGVMCYCRKNSFLMKELFIFTSRSNFQSVNTRKAKK